MYTSRSAFKRRHAALCIMVALALAALAGCTTSRPGPDEPPNTDQSPATHVAHRAVWSAHDRALFELINAYERRGLDRQATQLRQRFRDHPVLSETLRRQSIRKMLDQRGNFETARALGALREKYPDTVSRREYVEFLAKSIRNMSPSRQRYELLEELASLDPTHDVASRREWRKAQIFRAGRLTMRGKYADAIELSEQVRPDLESDRVRLTPAMEAGLYESYARALLATDNPTRAADSLRTYVLNTYSGGQAGRFESAVSMFRQYDEGAAALEWADSIMHDLVKAGADMGHAYLVRARLRADEDAPVEAVVADLRRVVDARPFSGNYLEAHRILDDHGYPDEGVQFLEQLVEEKSSTVHLKKLVSAYLDLGRVSKAEQTLQRYISEDPGARRYAQVASWIKRAGRDDLAKRWARKAWESDPDNWMYAFELLRLAHATGDASLAAKLVVRLREMSGDDVSRLRSLGRHLEAQGNLKDALELYWKALRLNPSYRSTAMDIARIESQRGHPEKVIEALESTVNSRYPSARSFQSAGVLAERFVDVRHALPFYRKAAENGRTAALANYLSALLRAGQLQTLHQEVERFVAENPTSSTSMEVLATRLSIEDLPVHTRRTIATAYAETNGRNPRLVQLALEHYAAAEEWSKALTFLEKRLTRRTRFQFPQLLRELQPQQARRVAKALLAEADAQMANASVVDDARLLFVARLHVAFAEHLEARHIDAPIHERIASRRTARELYASVLERRRGEETTRVDWQLLHELRVANFHRLAEHCLTMVEAPDDPQKYWEAYHQILEQAGRYGAASRIAEKLFTYLPPIQRVTFARDRARNALRRGHLDTAERFVRRALAASHLARDQTFGRNTLPSDLLPTLAAVLLTDGRVDDYRELLRDQLPDYSGSSQSGSWKLHDAALEPLWHFGNENAYIAELETLHEATSAPHWAAALADAYVEQDRTGDAMELSNTYVDHPDYILRTARTLAKENEPDAALRLLDKYAANDPSRPKEHLVLQATVLLRMGRELAAARVLKDARPGKLEAITPGQWGRLYLVATRSDSRETIDSIVETLSPAVKNAARRGSGGGAFETRRALDLSDYQPFESSGRDDDRGVHSMLINSGLAWLLAADLEEQIGGKSPLNAQLYGWRMKDELIRLGLMSAFLDNWQKSTKTRGPAGSHLPSLLILDGRTQAAATEIMSLGHTQDAPPALVFAGEFEDAIEEAVHLKQSDDLAGTSRRVDLAALHTLATLLGRGDEFARAFSLRRGTSADDVDATVLKSNRQIRAGHIERVLNDARATLDDALTHGLDTPEGYERFETALYMLEVAGVSDYPLEVADILDATNEREALPESAIRALRLFGGSEDTPDDIGALRHRGIADYIDVLIQDDHSDVAQRVLDQVAIPNALGTGSRPSQLAALEFDMAALRGNDAVTREQLRRALPDIYIHGDNAGRAHNDALVAGHTDLYALALYTTEVRRKLGNPEHLWRVMIGLDRPELARRTDRRVESANRFYPARLPTGAYWPAVGSRTTYLQEMEERQQAYPADDAVTVSLILSNLFYDPVDVGRAQLESYVDANAGRPHRVSRLIDALHFHSFHSEIASVLLPRVEPSELPALTINLLFQSAITTGHLKDADQLASLLGERLPNHDYLVAELAREAALEDAGTVADRLLAEAKTGKQALPYVQAMRAFRMLQGGHADRGAQLVSEMMDRRDLAPRDHCPILVAATHAQQRSLQDRIAQSLLRLPPGNFGPATAAQGFERLAKCFIGAGLAEEGLDVARRVAPAITAGDLTAQDYRLTVQVARLEREAGRILEAEKLLRSALATARLIEGQMNTPALRLDLARTLLDKHRPRAALSELVLAMNGRKPRIRAEALRLQARAHLALGRRELGMQLMRIAYVRHPDPEQRNLIRIQLMGLDHNSPP